MCWRVFELNIWSFGMSGFEHVDIALSVFAVLRDWVDSMDIVNKTS